MNCTRVCHIFDTRSLPAVSIMPVDIAMRLCLAHSPPMRNFLGPYDPYGGLNITNRLKPLRPCIILKGGTDSCNEGWAQSKGKRKKTVAFADDKGLSLTAVHFFSECEDSFAELQFDLTDLDNTTCGLKVNERKPLVLDFALPSADYLEFRNRLKKNFVCLENCTLREKFIAGTVTVRNLSYHKVVQIRITFDTWKSYKDVDCTFLNNIYGCSETDTFSFAIDLPSSLLPQERIEFCISFKCGDQLFWDNNEGMNYGIVHAEWKPDGTRAPIIFKDEMTKVPGKLQMIECDQFGSPRSSSGPFPEWQSWGKIETALPYW
ncbi:protein phosphatase 1 regulatory subunit 3C-B [Carcharodon carcharias]|uniref:protein phosphatase 1 regulatory subunit 3C-B n=1 Tax=Carcharodon carcharias TaxID=13397 RepID=UPI001B7E46AA|nr:protein phosphatase 1 regulatory subunit 3C-B [Carcharodon carcharias]XP_041065300.1 protein phosphatase 1 regulatory subunit 3C-B [Carcharodon carcharias]